MKRDDVILRLAGPNGLDVEMLGGWLGAAAHQERLKAAVSELEGV